MNLYYYIDPNDNNLVLPSGKRVSMKEFEEMLSLPYNTRTDKAQRIALLSLVR